MIGVINNTRIFEFYDVNSLNEPLSIYASKYSADSVIIFDSSDKIKGVIYRDNFTFPINLSENVKYYICGTVNDDSVKNLKVNDYLPKKSDWQLDIQPFGFCTQRIPKELDIY